MKYVLYALVTCMALCFAFASVYPKFFTQAALVAIFMVLLAIFDVLQNIHTSLSKEKQSERGS